MEHGAHFKWALPREKLPTVGEPKKAELFYDESFEFYLKDATHFNAGGVVEMLDSPRNYIYGVAGYHETPDEEPDYFRFGRAIHMAVLEPDRFRRHFICEPRFEGETEKGEMSTRSKKAKELRAEWFADLPADALVLSEKELNILLEIIDCLLEHPQASNMFKNGKPEVTGRFTHPIYGVNCKIRPDYLTVLPNGEIYFFDLKSTRSADARLFSSESARLLYHVKMSFYWDGLTEIFGRPPTACALIPVEKNIPSRAEVYWLNEDDLAKGRRKCHYAFETLLKCVNNNKWPRRKAVAQMLSLPNYTEDESLPEFEWGEDGPEKASTAESQDAPGLQQGGPSGGADVL